MPALWQLVNYNKEAAFTSVIKSSSCQDYLQPDNYT